MFFGQVWIQSKHKLLKGNFTILFPIQKIIKTSSNAFHVVVFFLIERFKEILNQDDLFTVRNLIKVISQIKDFFFGDCFAFLK
jgi:hypothetical protein